MKNPVGWFEIPVTDMDRAQKFYENLFEIALERHDLGPLTMAWFPMHEDTIGAAGSLVKGDSYNPSHNGAVLYFTTSDIDAALERVEKNGGTILNPKKDIGEYGFVAHFEDTEGNRVALHRRK